MIIQIIGNSKDIFQGLPFLDVISAAVHDNGGIIARDWISRAKNRDRDTVWDKTKIDWDDIHQETCDAIDRADIVIVEATNYTFKEGFYTSQALQQKKPVLLVTREDVRGKLIHGIKHKLLTTLRYENEEDLKKIVNKFIKSNTIATKDLRFNFFIDRSIYSYLREVSYETGKNKSEIIRELLEEEIDKQDRS